MFKPLVSILINNHNYEHFVGAAINSALQQTYERIEIIVVDDGSTDGSRGLIEAFGNQVITVYKENQGQSSTFNNGFARSSGEIICFLDADDLFLPLKVGEIVDAYQEQATGWCFHPLQWVDGGAQPIAGGPDVRYLTGRYDLRAEYLRGKPVLWAPATSGLTFRRTLLEKLLPMPSHIRITSDNYLTFSAPAFAPGFYISERLSLQRIHGSNAYTAKNDPQFKAGVQLAIAKGLHDAFPQLGRLSNKLFANAVAAKWTAGAGFGEFSGDLRQYLRSCGLGDKAEVLARTAYRILRPRRPGGSTFLNPKIQPTTSPG